VYLAATSVMEKSRDESLQPLHPALSNEDDDVIYMEPTGYGDDFRRRQMRAADRLSIRLLAVEDDADEEDRVLRQSLRLIAATGFEDSDDEDDAVGLTMLAADGGITDQDDPQKARRRVAMMIACAAIGILGVIGTILTVEAVIGPPSQPVGPYGLVELQEGDNFFNYYSFYEGPDSIGSNGFLRYVNRQHATDRDILNVTYEEDALDALYMERLARRQEADAEPQTDVEGQPLIAEQRPFVYMGTAPTNAGPRDSIRLEGSRRFNRGLFM
jgi:hypothetical protein